MFFKIPIKKKIQRLVKAIKCFYYFKNPFTLIKFYNGSFIKGKSIRVKPRKGNIFFVARSGDFWLINKIMNNKKVTVCFDSKKNRNYIIEDNIYLRQGTSDTFIYQEIFIDECYKEAVDQLTKDSIVIDIGAHIGLFSLYCSPKCKRVFAYEAHPLNYDLLLKNIESRAAENVNPYNFAVWSFSDKEVQISNDSKGQTGEYTINTNNNNNKMFSQKGFQAKTITLKDIFTQNNLDFCDLLKIDIEGAEYSVLLSTPDTVFAKINCIYLEYHSDLGNRYTVTDLMYFLKNKNFTIKTNEIKNSHGLLYAQKNVDKL
ncbi:FkbM family methyltransferase [Patescibacteria group bacterium]|nr:FkbM family methyltransferase [Patescibacteria group bacterium]